MWKIKMFSHIECDEWRPTEGLLQKAHIVTYTVDDALSLNLFSN
jgi:hypothetical protein